MFRVSIVSMGVVLISSSSALAGTVSGLYVGYGAYQTWGAGYKQSLLWDSVETVNLSNLKFSERLWDTGTGTNTVTWCAQVYQGVTPGNNYTFDVVALDIVPQTPPAPGPMGMAKAVVMQDAMARWLTADSRVIASAGSANAAAAAFNALVWEIVNDNFVSSDASTIASRMSLTAGAFRSNLGGEALGIYNTMIASLGQGGWQTTATEGWLSITAQDQIRMVPTPGALALLGAAGLVGRRRRR